MYQNQNYKKTQNANPYLTQKIMSASPDQLIAYIYEAGATACATKDRYKAARAVSALIQALNFEYKETATTFFNVYRYLNRLIIKGRFDEARDVFVELKNTWSKAFKTV